MYSNFHNIFIKAGTGNKMIKSWGLLFKVTLLMLDQSMGLHPTYREDNLIFSILSSRQTFYSHTWYEWVEPSPTEQQRGDYLVVVCSTRQGAQVELWILRHRFLEHQRSMFVLCSYFFLLSALRCCSYCGRYIVWSVGFSLCFEWHVCAFLSSFGGWGIHNNRKMSSV